VIKKLALAFVFTIACWTLQSQNPPHPNGGAVPNSGSNTPVGGGAPIDGGMFVMLIAGIAYASKKNFHLLIKK
jgi:hypothetical protein